MWFAAPFADIMAWILILMVEQLLPFHSIEVGGQSAGVKFPRLLMEWQPGTELCCFGFFFFSIRGDLGIPHSLFCSRISHRIHDFKHETNRSQKACEFLWGKGAHKKKEICRLNYENSKMHTFSFFSSCWWKLSW